ncbi:hypothetical protein ACFS4T_04205 [Pseudomonas lini]
MSYHRHWLTPCVRACRTWLNSAKTDLLAAGKLAGDPQALLLQAERELGASLDQLSQYASGNATYLTPLLVASQHLGKLSLARDKLVSSGRSELAADVEREVANIRTQAEQLDALPLLGVTASTESNTDDFAAMMGLENTEKNRRRRCRRRPQA